MNQEEMMVPMTALVPQPRTTPPKEAPAHSTYTFCAIPYMIKWMPHSTEATPSRIRAENLCSNLGVIKLMTNATMVAKDVINETLPSVSFRSGTIRGMKIPREESIPR